VGLRRFGVVVVSACYSHYQAGDKLLRALEPLVTGAVLVVSYALRPQIRDGRAIRGSRVCIKLL
jgi:hypothetical protein